MKKYLQYILIATISAVLLSACNKDEDNTVTLTAIVADQLNGGNAKVYINETGGVKYGCWQNGDTININGAKKYLSVTSGESLTAAINDVDASNTGYTAGYPYGKTTYSGTPKSISIDIPAVQEYISADDYSGTGASAKQRLLCPMAAYCGSNGSSLKFHNVGAVLKVTVSNSYEELLTLHSVEVESEDATVPLSGTCSVTMNDAGEISEATYEGSSKTTLDLSNAGKSLAKNGDPIDLYIPIMPIKESKRTKITIHVYAKGTPDGASSENKYTFHGTSASTVWVDRNQIGAVSIELSSSNKTANDPYFWGQGYSWCPFLIEDYEDLKQLSALVAVEDNDGTYNNSNCYYKQTKDITITDANWGSSDRLAIGSTTNAFKANYDGNNDTIKMAISSATKDYPVGAFGVVGTGASICNVITYGSINSGEKSTSVGGIVGLITGNVTVSYCDNSVAITSTHTTTSYGKGGICGEINADGCTIYIENCNNNGAVSTSAHVPGGIVGIHKDGTLNIIDCNNNSSISQSKESNTCYSGGIIGQISSGTETVTLTRCNNNNMGTVSGCINVGGLIGKTSMNTVISSCNNYATISTSGTGTSYRNNIGGMVGLSDAEVTFKGTNNQTGNVSGFYDVGGIIGQNQKDVIIEEDASILVGSEQKGVNVEYKGGTTISYFVTSTYSTQSMENAVATSGFIGYSYGLVIKGEVELYGKVKNADGCSKMACVGGLIGSMYKNEKHNKGTSFVVKSTGSVKSHMDVTGTKNIGGLVGLGIWIGLYGQHYNYGDVSGTDNVGGIIGGNYYKSVTINGEGVNSTANNGKITGDGEGVGGIIGYSGTKSSIILYNCSNYKKIKGTKNVAGIIGKYNANEATYHLWAIYCSNEGEIEATGGSSQTGVAGILGYVNNTKGIHLYNCSNTNSIAASAGNAAIAVGGIAGNVEGKGTIYNCYNSGGLSGNNVFAIGGICGATINSTAKDTISNCYNHGTISGSTSSTSGTGMAGIVGAVRNSSIVYVNNCYNKSKIIDDSENPVYGIAGRDAGNLYVYNSYGPSSHEIAGNNLNRTGNIYTYRCSTLKEVNNVVTGDLSNEVMVNKETNSSNPSGNNPPKYSTLYDALTKWRECVNGVSISPSGWAFLEWTNASFPTFNTSSKRR